MLFAHSRTDIRQFSSAVNAKNKTPHYTDVITTPDKPYNLNGFDAFTRKKFMVL